MALAPPDKSAPDRPALKLTGQEDAPNTSLEVEKPPEREAVGPTGDPEGYPQGASLTKAPKPSPPTLQGSLGGGVKASSQAATGPSVPDGRKALTTVNQPDEKGKVPEEVTPKENKIRPEDDLVGSSQDTMGWGIMMDPQSVMAIGVILVLLVAALWYFLPDFGGDDPEAAEGFILEVWADGLNEPTSLTWGPDNSLYVGLSGGGGYIEKFQNISGDLRHGQFISGTQHPHGLQWVGNWLYVSDRTPNGDKGQLEAYQADGEFGRWAQHRILIDDLPVGEHQNNGLTEGPDGYLYLAVGATCKRCDPVPHGSAAILRVDPSNGNYTIFADGLGNSYDVAFRPGTNHLFASENGGDDTKRYDELNWIEPGGHYGWPNDAVDTPEGSLPPLLKLPANTVPTGMVFTTTTNLTGRAGDLILALSGTQEDEDKGHSIIKVNLTYDPLNQEYRYSTETLATGLAGPIDIALGPDGALYIADYITGQILKLGSN